MAIEFVAREGDEKQGVEKGYACGCDDKSLVAKDIGIVGLGYSPNIESS